MAVPDPSTIALVGEPTVAERIYDHRVEEAKQSLLSSGPASASAHSEHLEKTAENVEISIWPPPLPVNVVNQLIDAITNLGHVVSRLDKRMEVVESLAARASVPPAAAEPVPVKDVAETQDGLREAMWNRTAQRLAGGNPEHFIPETPPVVVAPSDPLCKTCHTNKRYGPSKYCLPCLQEQQRNRCPRCNNVMPEEANGCATCTAEARVLERMKPGVRHQVGSDMEPVMDPARGTVPAMEVAASDFLA
jgi:hypothetical protein